MNATATQQAVSCPVVESKKGLSMTDRLCHIPGTRHFFIASFPETPCHRNGECQACETLSEKAQEEIGRNENAAAARRRRNGSKWLQEIACVK